MVEDREYFTTCKESLDRIDGDGRDEGRQAIAACLEYGRDRGREGEREIRGTCEQSRRIIYR